MSTAINLTNCHVAKEPGGEVHITQTVRWGGGAPEDWHELQLQKEDALKLRDWLNEQFPEKKI